MGSHLTSLFQMLPRGSIYPRQGSGSVLEQLFTGIGEEFDEFEEDVRSVLLDIFPDRTGDFLEDWESLLGIEGVSVLSDPESRSAAVVAFLTLSPESNIEFFERICAIFGYDITITRGIYRCCQAGSGQAGDQINNPRLQFVWVVSVPEGPDPGLEYIINLFKPAHTYVSFLVESSP